MSAPLLIYVLWLTTGCGAEALSRALMETNIQAGLRLLASRYSKQQTAAASKKQQHKHQQPKCCRALLPSTWSPPIDRSGVAGQLACMHPAHSHCATVNQVSGPSLLTGFPAAARWLCLQWLEQCRINTRQPLFIAEQ